MKGTGLILATAVAVALSLAIAGNLEPPGPPAPTMKDLDTVEPRTPLRNDFDGLNPIVISQSGSYYLAEDIYAFPDQHGIEITASNVTLDLRGFTIYGNTEVGSLSGVKGGGGPTQKNVRIHNGTVRDFFEAGIDLGQTSSVDVESVRALFNSTAGISVGANSRIERCLAEGNVGIGLIATDGSVIIGSGARDNDSGIEIARGVVTDCAAFSNNLGIGGSDSLIRGNTAYSNGTNILVANSVVIENQAP